MASGNLSPRQKMIGMMYLVLTALLALNVSKEILDAFVTINNGLETTKVTFDGKLSQTYAAFQASYNENPEKYGDAWDDAQVLKQQSDDLVSHIDKIKAKIIGETEGVEDPLSLIGTNEMGVDTVLGLRYVEGRDNYDTNTNIMVGSEPAKPKTNDAPDGNNYRAAVLKDKLTQYGDDLKTMIGDGNPSLKKSLDSLFTYPEKMKDASGTVTNWESMNFYHVPLAATVAILSKLQADVRNAESDVLNHLFADVEAASFKFTTLKPVVLPEKTYVLEGDTFRAEVFLAAYDETKPPTVLLGPEGAEVDSTSLEIKGGEPEKLPTRAGKGVVKLPARGVGEKHWEGVIKFKGPQGTKTYPYDINYEVAKPALVVSPIKMNVLYRGVENPIAISVPGISANKLKPTMTNGTLTKRSDGTYIATNLGGQREAVVNVSAEIDGQTQRMGDFTFRVKNVPDPKAKFAGKTAVDNTVGRAELKAALGVIADLEDFEFDLKFPVTSFDLAVITGGEVKTLSSNNNRLTPQMQELLDNVRRNQVILVENIKAKAPDGTIRKLGGINLKIR